MCNKWFLANVKKKPVKNLTNSNQGLNFLNVYKQFFKKNPHHYQIKRLWKYEYLTCISTVKQTKTPFTQIHHRLEQHSLLRFALPSGTWGILSCDLRRGCRTAVRISGWRIPAGPGQRLLYSPVGAG